MKVGESLNKYLNLAREQKKSVTPIIIGTALKKLVRGARGVMVIVVENGHRDTSSNPGRD